MAYQKCPVCNGTGKIENTFVGYTTSSTPTHETCHVCNGAGIISEFTGLPPTGKEKVGDRSYKPTIPDGYIQLSEMNDFLRAKYINPPNPDHNFGCIVSTGTSGEIKKI
jgi:DnaJ-class molecular chaperone